SYRDIDFARKHGIGHYSIIPNGASEAEFDAAPDPGFRRRLGIPEDNFLFLTVGGLTGLKGHREVAEAFARLDTGGRAVALILNGNKPLGLGAPSAAREGAARMLFGRALVALRQEGMGMVNRRARALL